MKQSNSRNPSMWILGFYFFLLLLQSSLWFFTGSGSYKNTMDTPLPFRFALPFLSALELAPLWISRRAGASLACRVGALLGGLVLFAPLSYPVFLLTSHGHPPVFSFLYLSSLVLLFFYLLYIVWSPERFDGWRGLRTYFPSGPRTLPAMLARAAVLCCAASVCISLVLSLA